MQKKSVSNARLVVKTSVRRFFTVSELLKADVIVRITGDCPLIDVEIVDYCLDGFVKRKVDYLSNVISYFPDGLDVEVF